MTNITFHVDTRLARLLSQHYRSSETAIKELVDHFLPFTSKNIHVLLIGGKRENGLSDQYQEPNTTIMIFDEIICNSRNQLNWLLKELGGEAHA